MSELVRDGIQEVHIAGESFVLRDLQPSDEADQKALLALHTEVFGSAADTSWFGWKYWQGGGQGVGLWLGTRMVAYCGGTPRSVCHQGAWKHDLQIGDVMVAPEWRGVLTRRGPFFHVCDRFYRSRIGAGQPFDVAWGFPNQRHLHLAVKMGLSWDAGLMHGLTWTTAGAALPWHIRSEPWQIEADTSPDNPPDGLFDRTIQMLWTQMKRSPAAAGVSLGIRDAAYLRWRYLHRPDRNYQWVCVRRAWSTRPLGVAVVAEAPSDGALLWLDWIGPMQHLPLAALACRTHARQVGATYLNAWASEPVCLALADSGVNHRSVVAGLGVPVASDVTDNQVAALNWWFMGGDTDFL